MKNKKAMILCAIVLVVLLACAALLYLSTHPETHAGSKTVTFQIVYKDGTSESFDLKTDAEFLADALVEAGLVAYSEDGMYITINGVTADWNDDQSWWNICKNGEALMVGMNDQPIADGEIYEAVYTFGS